MFPEFEGLFDQIIASGLFLAFVFISVLVKRLTAVASDWVEAQTGSTIVDDLFRDSAVEALDQIENKVSDIVRDGVVTKQEFNELVATIENVFILKLRNASKEASTYVAKTGSDLRPKAKRYALDLLERLGIAIDDEKYSAGALDKQ